MNPQDFLYRFTLLLTMIVAIEGIGFYVIPAIIYRLCHLRKARGDKK